MTLHALLGTLSSWCRPEPAQHVETIRCSSYHTGHVLPPGKMVVQDHDKRLEGVNYLEWVGADSELGGGTAVLDVQTSITTALVWLMVTLLSCVQACSLSSLYCRAV